MRRPVTVFAWIRHQQAIGCGCRPSARSVLTGSAATRKGRCTELHDICFRPLSIHSRVCSVLGASAPKLAGGASVRA